MYKLMNVHDKYEQNEFKDQLMKLCKMLVTPTRARCLKSSVFGSPLSKTQQVRLQYPRRRYTIHTKKIECKQQLCLPPPKNDNIKNLTLASMLFSNLTVYTIVRDTKDVLLVTACGAEAIPFMKTWFNFPLSIVSILYFSFLNNKGLDTKWVYRLTYLPIAFLYSLVGLVLYPNRHLIQPTLPLDGSFLHPIMASIANNWVSAAFYSLASIWGSMVISLLFWMVANQYTDVITAKKIYPLFGFIANFALIFAGIIMNKFSILYSNDWGTNMHLLMSVVFIFCSLSYGLYEFLSSHFDPVNAPVIKKSKKKVSLQEGIMNMFKEPFIRNMVFVIASYGSCIALYETCWKRYMYMYFPTPVEYSQFMGAVSYMKGLMTMAMMIMSSFILKHMKFSHSLLITPVTLTAIGIFFYASIFMNLPIVYVVYSGAVMGICTKALKYSFFDPNKEIAYIPMGEEIKTKGKATIEVISNPLGKSGSSLVLQSLILFYGSLMDALPMIALYFGMTCMVWIYVANEIGKTHDTVR